MTELMDSPLLAPLADLLTPDKVETLQEMARVFYSNRSDISVARHCFCFHDDSFCSLFANRSHAETFGKQSKNVKLGGWPNI